MGYVSRLELSEPVRIHTESLCLLQSTLGVAGSQDVIERAIVEVAERIGQIEQCLQLGDLDQMRRLSRGLAAISEQLGLTKLAQVASDAIQCANRSDMVSLHAVTQRLIRVGDASLAAAIDGAVPPD